MSTQAAPPRVPQPRTLMPAPETESTSLAAVWSLVTALLGLLFFPLFLVAIVLGHIGRGKCKRDLNLQGKGLALTGLILGYTGSALIVVAGLSLFVAFNSWKADVRTALKTDIGGQAAGGEVSDEGEALTGVQIDPDPQAVQAHIDRFQKDAQHPIDRQLAEVDEGYTYLDREVFEAYPDRAKPVLVKLAQAADRDPTVRATAAWILLGLAADIGKPYLRGLLQHADTEVRTSALDALDGYANLASAHTAWLEPLVLAQLEDQDPAVAGAAVRAAAGVNTPAVKTRLQALLKGADKDTGSELATALVDTLIKIGSNDATVDILLRQLAAAEDLYGAEERLENCFRWASARSKAKLLAILQDRHRAGDEAAIEYICAHADATCLPLIETYLKKPSADYRADALRAVMRIKGAAALPVLQAAFKESDLQNAAVAVAGETFAGTSNSEVLDALAQLNRTDFYAKNEIVKAAMAVSPETLPPVVKEIAAKISPADDQASDIFWYLQNITIEAALADFVKTGLIDDRSYAAEIAAVKAEYDSASPSFIFLEVLQKADILTWFDVEVGTIPVPHDDLLDTFRSISGGRFQATHIDQAVIGDVEKDVRIAYKLAWVCQDKLYTVAPQNYGDWYDLGAVIDGANRALEDNGQPERFFLLDTGDQTAQVIFGDQAALETMAAKYHLPIVTDSDAAMARGQAFESQVRQLIASGEVR